GWDFNKSRKLIDMLINFSTQEQFTYQHKWNVGDMVLWDNRSAMHRGMAFDDQNAKRRLHRTTIAGTGPLL
ncbi:MAG: TauD/TfdA family dioxygenase, partial [Pseudomonadota bacterium]|nr:TauD/TfdA family dioxygenase [Pseudomonadota bacterium]